MTNAETGEQEERAPFLLIFDLDETLIHTVDDPDNESHDVLVHINFAGEPEPVPCGFNVRPFARECLAQAN